MTQPLFQSAPTRASSSITARSNHGFFVCMAALLLATVLVGFAPSFYLRAYFGTPPLPTYLQLHGVVLTAWFLLFFVQTSLVAAHRVNLHRRLGVAGGALAAAVVVVSALVTIRSIPRSTSIGLQPDQIVLTVANAAPITIVFLVLVICGFSFRRRPETHKRLMLLSCMSTMGPAISRLPPVRELPVLNLIVLLPLLALVMHDLVLNRHVHRATFWGELFFLISLAITGALVGSDAGPWLVHMLSSLSL